ncbi:MAG TPA: hypothetical protein VF472_21745 [Burkholderiaceae bacterium]
MSSNLPTPSQTERIRVEFTQAELARLASPEVEEGEVGLPSEFLIEMRALQLLRDAGIPVIGMLKFGGIRAGTLTRQDEFEKIVFTWSRETASTVPPATRMRNSKFLKRVCQGFQKFGQICRIGGAAKLGLGLALRSQQFDGAALKTSLD